MTMMIMMNDRQGAGRTASGFAPTVVLAHTASQHDNCVAIHVVDRRPGTAVGHVGTSALGGASRCDAGAPAIIPIDTLSESSDGNAFIDVRGSADGMPADTFAGSAVAQRVGVVSYRMCAVYRAVSGFASLRSLNPVRS